MLVWGLYLRANVHVVLLNHSFLVNVRGEHIRYYWPYVVIIQWDIQVICSKWHCYKSTIQLLLPLLVAYVLQDVRWLVLKKVYLVHVLKVCCLLALANQILMNGSSDGWRVSLLLFIELDVLLCVSFHQHIISLLVACPLFVQFLGIEIDLSVHVILHSLNVVVGIAHLLAINLILRMSLSTSSNRRGLLLLLHLSQILAGYEIIYETEFRLSVRWILGLNTSLNRFCQGEVVNIRSSSQHTQRVPLIQLVGWQTLAWGYRDLFKFWTFFKRRVVKGRSWC